MYEWLYNQLTLLWRADLCTPKEIKELLEKCDEIERGKHDIITRDTEKK